MSNKTPLLLFFGPSGAGKSTLAEFMEKKYPKTYFVYKSYSTRLPRKSEIENNNYPYFYLTKKKFKEKIKESFFSEYSQYRNNFYGSNYYHQSNSKIPIHIVDINGALNIKKNIKRYKPILFFVTTRTKKILIDRIKKRGDIYRLKNIDSELKNKKYADYTVLTDNTPYTNLVQEIHSILHRSMAKPSKTSDPNNCLV